MILYNYYNQKMEFYLHTTYCFAFCIVALYWVDVYLLELISFVAILYMVVDTIYIYFKLILISIMTISIQLYGRYFIKYTMSIMMGFNDGDYRSHYKFIYGYCLSLIHVLVMYLSITSSELIF